MAQSEPDAVCTKELFVGYCRLLYDRRLVAGVGGNLSVRSGESVLVTPSGFSLRDITPDCVVVVDPKGNIKEGGRPTRDLDFHLSILKHRPEIGSVCHVHGAHLVAATTLLDPGPDTLPPLTPGFVYFAYPLAMLHPMVPGRSETARAIDEIFRSRDCFAVLLQNHGLVTAGKDFFQALNIAEEVEEAARVYVLTGGRARPIPEDQVREIKAFRAHPLPRTRNSL